MFSKGRSWFTLGIPYFSQWSCTQWKGPLYRIIYPLNFVYLCCIYITFYGYFTCWNIILKIAFHLYDIDFVVLILFMYFTDIGILLWSYWAGTRSSYWRFSDIDTKQRKCPVYEYSPGIHVSRKILFPLYLFLSNLLWILISFLAIAVQVIDRMWKSLLWDDLNMRLLHIYLCWFCLQQK
jgi:hypothetical protein